RRRGRGGAVSGGDAVEFVPGARGGSAGGELLREREDGRRTLPDGRLPICGWAKGLRPRRPQDARIRGGGRRCHRRPPRCRCRQRRAGGRRCRPQGSRWNPDRNCAGWRAGAPSRPEPGGVHGIRPAGAWPDERDGERLRHALRPRQVRECGPFVSFSWCWWCLQLHGAMVLAEEVTAAELVVAVA
ncbi:unnamed protein product, partial [Phaeothamnion confervicola]